MIYLSLALLVYSQTREITDLTTYQNNTSFQVCREWEATALGVNKNVRLALIRIGVVLGKDGGALGMILSSESCFRLAKSTLQLCHSMGYYFNKN